MKNAPLTLTLAIAFLVPAHCPADTDEAIAEIRRWYAELAELGTSVKTSWDLKDPEGPLEGEITVSHHTSKETKNTQSKVFLSYVASDHGGADETYHFGPDGLYFALIVEYSWRFGGEPDKDGNPGTIDALTETRLYFKGGKCIHKLVRSAEADDQKKLGKLIQTKKNKAVKPGQKATETFRKGLALKGASSAAEVVQLLLFP